MQANTYCLSCRKDTKNIDPKVVKAKNNGLMMLPKRAICGKKRSDLLESNKQKDC